MLDFFLNLTARCLVLYILFLVFCAQIADMVQLVTGVRDAATSALTSEIEARRRYKQELRERHDAIVKEEREKWESQRLEQQVRDVMTNLL